MIETLQRHHEVRTLHEKSLPTRKVLGSSKSGTTTSTAAVVTNGKRKRGSDEEEAVADEDDGGATSEQENGDGFADTGAGAGAGGASAAGMHPIIVSRPLREVRGHTSFLVFASVLID